MKPALTTLLLVLFTFHAQANAGLQTGTATNVTATTASGLLNGVGWTATTTSSSPFLGINMGSGVWDLGNSLPNGGLFLGVGDVNAGDTQVFNFDAPVKDVMFYVENFDSNSMANVSTDASLSIVSATTGITFSPTSSSEATLSTSNSSFDGIGDFILKLTGPASYISFDYTAGDGGNGIFYGFAQDTASTAVPEPSSALFLMLCGGLAIAARRRKLAADDAA